MFVPENSSIKDRLRFALTRQISKGLRLVGKKQKQLIVCGYPRSGTSLLYNMLSSSINLNFKFTEFENYFMFYLHKLGDMATKAPLDVLHLDFVDELNIHNKDLIILVMIRDIREIITSKHPIYPDDYFVGYDNSFWPQDKDFVSWKYDAPGVLEISKAIKAARDRRDVMIVKYEDLTSDPDTTQIEIARKYGLKFNGLFSRYYERKDSLPYRYSGKYKARDSSLVLEGEKVKQRAKRWMKPEHRKRIVEQFESCPELFDLLVEYEYEKDDMWFHELVANSK